MTAREHYRTGIVLAMVLSASSGAVVGCATAEHGKARFLMILIAVAGFAAMMDVVHTLWQRAPTRYQEGDNV